MTAVNWPHLVILLALLQLLIFSFLVGWARGRYGVKAPATTGHEIFERYYRVQMNTIELLVMFIPALWIAAQHWSPARMAAIGAIYLIGRVIYLFAYTRNPASRSLGFGLSLFPIIALWLAALVGVVAPA